MESSVIACKSFPLVVIVCMSVKTPQKYIAQSFLGGSGPGTYGLCLGKRYGLWGVSVLWVLIRERSRWMLKPMGYEGLWVSKGMGYLRFDCML